LAISTTVFQSATRLGSRLVKEQKGHKQADDMRHESKRSIQRTIR
jgi:hypothetical protein